jgi:hypothetical protein
LVAYCRFLAKPKYRVRDVLIVPFFDVLAGAEHQIDTNANRPLCGLFLFPRYAGDHFIVIV